MDTWSKYKHSSILSVLMLAAVLLMALYSTTINVDIQAQQTIPTFAAAVPSVKNRTARVPMPSANNPALTQTLPTTTNNDSNIKKIVLFNKPGWRNMKQWNTLIKTCEYRNCEFTTSKTQLTKQAAILYSLTSVPNLPKEPPIQPANRRRDQAWIFAFFESPVSHRGGFARYKSPPWRDTVNWTMSYTRDSDIFHPIGIVSKRANPPSKNYSEIFRRKHKMAAWLVSHCGTHGRREKYVQLLREHNVTVDVYGACSGKRLPQADVAALLNDNYKFYLSFENSLCKDYITEKFYRYLLFDVVLVVRGGGNYSSLVPSDSFINTADFESVKDLANYMKEVAASEILYTEYLRNKDRFDAIPHVDSNGSLCSMCEKLNNIEDNRHIYKNVVDKINKDTCHVPKDIL